jgi:hypothetical protein
VYIKAGERTPEIQVDDQLREVIFSGESYPENAINFYKPIMDKLDELCQNKNPLKLRFELIYINSSSLGMLRNMMSALERHAQQGLVVKVLWQAYQDDDNMREMGEDFKELYPHIALELDVIGD